MTDIKDYQMWKLDENSETIVSKFNNGIIGIYGNSILSAYTGDGDMVGAVSVDKTTSSNYDFKFTGGDVLTGRKVELLPLALQPNFVPTFLHVFLGMVALRE